MPDPTSDIALGVRTARATLDRIGLRAQSLPVAAAHRSQCALELARSALAILAMVARCRESDVRQSADRLARAAREFADGLGR